MRRLHRFIMPLLVGAFAITASGARPVVKAQLDSTVLLMGRSTMLKVTVEQEKSTVGRFPLLQQIQENGIIPVCGDSVELRAPSAADTVENGSGITIKLDIPVQSFDSGYYRLPRLAFVVGVDTAYSNPVALKVVPVAGLTAETPIDGYANVADPENSSVFDRLPDWVVDYWWLILLILIAAAAGIYVFVRYRRNGYIIPPKPQPTPYEVAVSGLLALKEKKLWEQGMEKEYFTELTEILRTYLYRRFGINAMEMTSRQILSALSGNAEIKEKRPYIRQILDMADFVKFAKVRPLPADNIASYDNALRFVRETKPVEPAQEEVTTAPVKSRKEFMTVGKGNANKKKGGRK